MSSKKRSVKKATSKVATKISGAAEFPYNDEKLLPLLFARSCDKLRFYCRVLRIQTDTSRLTKTSVVYLILDTMKDNFQRTGDIGISLASREELEAKFPDFKQQGWGSFLGFGKTNQDSKEEQIIYGLELTGFSRKILMEQRFKEKPCPGRQIEGLTLKEGDIVNPQYGMGSSSSRDCGPGYIQLQAGGCCIRVKNLVNTWDTEKVAENIDNLASSLGENEAEELRKYVQDGEKELDSALATSRFKSNKELKFVMEIVGNMQNNATTRLADKINSLLSEDDELCDSPSTEPEKAADYWQYLQKVSNPFVKFIKYLWWIMRKVLGFVWSTMKVVIGGVTRVLKTIGEKVAFFLMSNPRQARVMLAVAKLVRNRLCTWVGERLIEWNVFEKLNEDGLKQKVAMQKRKDQGLFERSVDNLQQAMTDGISLIKDSGKLDPISIADSLVKNGSLGKGFNYATKLLGGALSSIPIAGGLLSSASEIVGDLMRDSVEDAAKFSIEVIAYQNDFWETLTLLVEIVDVNQCLMKMPSVQFRLPGVYWYLEQASLVNVKKEAKEIYKAGAQEQSIAVAKQREILEEQRNASTNITTLDLAK